CDRSSGSARGWRRATRCRQAAARAGPLQARTPRITSAVPPAPPERTREGPRRIVAEACVIRLWRTNRDSRGRRASPGSGGCGTQPPQNGGKGTQPPHRLQTAAASGAYEVGENCPAAGRRYRPEIYRPDPGITESRNPGESRGNCPRSWPHPAGRISSHTSTGGTDGGISAVVIGRLGSVGVVLLGR